MGPVFVVLLAAAAVAAPEPAPAPAGGPVVLHPSARSGLADLFLTDPGKGDTRNLTRTEQAEEIHPAWSPDGARIAFACKTRDHEFEIYTCDAAGTNRKRVSAPPEVPGGAFAPSWSSDGKKLAYFRIGAGDRCEVRVAAADGSADEATQADAVAPAWSPDGRAVAFVRRAAGRPRALCLMAPDGSGVRVLVEDIGRVEFCFPAWSPDGRLIAYTAETDHGPQLFLVPPAGGTPRQLTHVIGVNINPVWLAADQLLFAHLLPTNGAGGGGGYASIKADGTRLEIHPLTLTERVNPLGRPAVHVPRPEPRPVRATPASPVRPAAFVEAAKHPAVKATPLLMIPPAAAGAVGAAAWSPDGTRLAVGLEAGAVLVGELDGAAVRPVESFRGHEGPVEAVAFSADGKHVYSAGADKSVRTWDVARKGSKAIETDHAAWVDALAVSADGKFVAAGDRSGTLKIRDAATGKPAAEAAVCDPKRGGVHAAAFGPGAVFAGSARWDVPVLNGAVAAFDPATGKELWRSKGMFGGVFALAVSPDGASLAGACLDGCVRIWDAKTGKERGCWQGHADRVTGVAWALGGRVVVSCGFDHTVRVWDAADGTPLHTLAAHSSPVIRVAASPDGKHLVSTGQIGAVFVWKLAEE